MQFFHLFFPSWRFFENTGSFLSLSFRSGSEIDQMSEWQPLQADLKRKWSQIFYNPEGNLVHTLNSQAAKLVQSLSSHEHPESLGPFIALKNYFEARTEGAPYFQFKIVGTQWDFAEKKDEDILISRIYSRVPAAEGRG